MSAVGSSVDSESDADSGVDTDLDSLCVVGGRWISSGGLESSVGDLSSSVVSGGGGAVDS